MNQHTSSESSKELLALAQEHGYSVSAMQLARWHRAGILPRPKQQSLGRGQGTQSRYPSGTGEQLLLLCELHKGERRLTHLAWHIWWEGYPVDLRLIRETLQKISNQLSERIRWFGTIQKLEEVSTNKATENTEHMLDFIEIFTTTYLDYKPLRRIRKRLGKEHFSTFIRILIDIAAGTFQGYSAAYDRRETLTELRILAKGLGQNELFRKDDVNLEHYIEKLLVPLLQETSLWLQTLPWEQALSDATDFDLLQARDEMRMLLTSFTQVEDTIALLQAKMRDYPLWGNAWQKNFSVTTMADEAIVLVIQLALRTALSTSHHTFSP